jgi:hypothetical protein
LIDLIIRVMALYDLGLSYDRIAKSVSLHKKISVYKVTCIIKKETEKRITKQRG